MVVRGVHGAELVDATGGGLRIGPSVGDGVTVLVDERDGVAVLRPIDGEVDSLAALSGPVVLWWPGQRGRCEVDGDASATAAGPVVQLRWPPRQVQQRGHVRAPVDADAWVVDLVGAGTASGRMLDLSAGGAAIVLDDTRTWWGPGTRVAVCIHLPGRPVVVAATVVRTGARGRHAGLRFDTVATGDEDRLTAVALAADSRRARR
jgi:hypothetical protein